MKDILRAYLLFLFLLLTMYGFAQNGNKIFDNSILHEIRFEFEEANYLEILTSNFEGVIGLSSPVPYLMGSVIIDNDRVDSVGIRFKGFTSYSFNSNKKPIKIDFNEFVKGKEFDGIKKINLNNGTGDPSMQRDIVCYDILRKSGVKAPRTSFSKVYFNDIYLGLYQFIEQIDEEFLDDNFENSKGNLFKNLGWSFLEWLGSDDNLYHPPFELKTNEEEPNWDGFVNLMDVLNNTSDAEFPGAIDQIFNVDLYLKTLAVDVATNNWDSYLEHGRNWYIYEDTLSDKFHWIPWDYNFALDGGLIGSDQNCEIYAGFWTFNNNTTTVPFYDNSFFSDTVEYHWDFGDGTTSIEKNPIHVYQSHGDYQVCLTISNDFMCEHEDCTNVSTTYDPANCPSNINGSFTHGVDQYYQRVIYVFPNCCDLWNDRCESYYTSLNDTDYNGSGYAIDQGMNDGVLINRLLAMPEYLDKYYTHFCDLLNYHMTKDEIFELIDHNKALIESAIMQESNSVFTFNEFENDIGDDGIKKLLSTRIDFLKIEIAEHISCQKASSVPFQEVVINELLASSSEAGMIADPAGEFDDWYELYNNTSSDIDLSGVYISDSKTDLKKWKVPSGTIIAAEDYLIIWADNDLEQMGIHCNYKLSKSGDELTMSNHDGTIIDSLTFGEQDTDLALARVPNGTGNFMIQTPTHGANNNIISNTTHIGEDDIADIYPNPASSMVNISIKNNKYSSEMRLYIRGITGKLLKSYNLQSESVTLDVSFLNSGMYLVQIEDNNGLSSNQKITIF